MTKDATSSHWDTYYRSRSVPDLPSQFAVFVLNEFRPAAVVDVGCGSGRDALFFASQGIPTLGVDASASAVELCSSKAGPALNATFRQADIKQPDFVAIVEDGLSARDTKGALLVYARFFIHAIDDEAERTLLRGVSHLLGRHGGVFAAEFRTTRDKSMTKVTPDHYRRFVNPADFAAEALQAGLRTTYFVEGFGLAKYKEDDAHVARFLLAPQPAGG